MMLPGAGKVTVLGMDHVHNRGRALTGQAGGGGPYPVKRPNGRVELQTESDEC